MNYRGLDIGYLFTKCEDGTIFKSAYTSEDKILLSDSKLIIIDGKKYYFDNGLPCMDTDKISSDVNMICTLASIAMNGDGEYSIVTGLPIDQYKTNRDKLKNMMHFYNNMSVIYQGRQVRFKIQNVEVYPQGAGALFSIPIKDGNYILIDLGSFTDNFAMFEVSDGKPNIIKYSTLYSGSFHLYTEIIRRINSKYNLSIDEKHVEFILKNGLYIDGEKQDERFIKSILQEYADKIIAHIKLEYPHRMSDVLLVGGGANLLFDIFKSEFKNVAIIPNPQFATAIGFHNICKKYFGGGK